MRVETYLSAQEAATAQITDGTAVVIDVIRATSTVVEALASGARAVYPTLSSEEAIRLVNSLGREDTLLCGGRKGLRLEGFDLGNSPREFTPDRVSGKRLVLSTTNGTRAFLAAEGADRVLAASFLNLSAAGEAVSDSERVVFVCAGKEGRFSLDDGLCAGLILQGLAGKGDDRLSNSWRLDDASKSVLALVKAHNVDTDLLRETAAGTALVEIGLEADLERCADVDRYQLVPEMHDRMISLPEEG